MLGHGLRSSEFRVRVESSRRCCSSLSHFLLRTRLTRTRTVHSGSALSPANRLSTVSRSRTTAHRPRPPALRPRGRARCRSRPSRSRRRRRRGPRAARRRRRPGARGRGPGSRRSRRPGPPRPPARSAGPGSPARRSRDTPGSGWDGPGRSSRRPPGPIPCRRSACGRARSVSSTPALPTRIAARLEHDGEPGLRDQRAGSPATKRSGSSGVSSLVPDAEPAADVEDLKRVDAGRRASRPTSPASRSSPCAVGRRIEDLAADVHRDAVEPEPRMLRGRRVPGRAPGRTAPRT